MGSLTCRRRAASARSPRNSNSTLLADSANATLPGADLLLLLFDPTPSEARIVRRLAEGAAIVDVANSVGIPLATARVHLRSAFARFGVKRQGDLIALVGRLAPPGKVSAG